MILRMETELELAHMDHGSLELRLLYGLQLEYTVPAFLNRLELERAKDV